MTKENRGADKSDYYRESYKFIFQNVCLGFVSVDIGSKKILEANPHFLKICGYNLQEVLGEDFNRIFEFELENIFNIKNGAINGAQFDAVVLCKDSSKRPVIIKPMIFKSTESKPDRLFFIIEEDHKFQTALQKKNELLSALTEINSRYISGASLHSVFNELLKILIRLTESEFGFIGEVKYAPYGRPYLKIHSFSNVISLPETKKLYNDYQKVGLEFHNLDNLFGAVITSRDVVISNDPKNDPRASGVLPRGHPEIKSFLGIPFKKGNTVIGVAGVANRKGGYSRDTVEYLNPFIATCACLIESAKTQAAKRDAEESLKKSLEEKIELLRELHHRVKNNFQVITSLLNLHARRLSDKTAAHFLDSLKNRIKAMAIIHEMLYKADNLSVVNAKDYLSKLCLYLMQSLKTDSSRIKIETNFEPIQLTIDCAGRLGFIANELISNAVLHAFPEKRSGKIVVELSAKPEKFITLTVADTGVGLPAGIDVDKLPTLGLQLCSQFVHNHNGKIVFSTSTTYKTIVTVTLPLSS